ncbi:MAG: tyrosine-type recombinase/integrase, partial [Clostridiales bacterium]|nr:tyrosine-type recombinase/integrase [Clostridiales bacterium]
MIWQQECAKKAGSAWNNEWNLVFTNELGNHLCHSTVYNNYKRIVKDLGIENKRFHDLRHTYAVASLESGDDIKTVQDNLGHATSSFTLDVYGHVSKQMKQRSAANMQNFINKVS